MKKIVAVAVVLVAGCQMREEDVTSTVEIVTVPEGAEVSFSSRDVGVGPVTVNNVESGKYIIRVTKPEWPVCGVPPAAVLRNLKYIR